MEKENVTHTVDYQLKNIEKSPFLQQHSNNWWGQEWSVDANVMFLGTDIHPDPKVSPRRLPINYGGGGVECR